MLKYREKMQKIIATIIILITCTFAVPNFSQADFGGKLFAPVVNLFAALGDVVIGGLQHWMLGTSSLWSASLKYDDPNVENMTDVILGEGSYEDRDENSEDNEDSENSENNENTGAQGSGSLTTVIVAGKNLDRGWVPFDGDYDDIAVPNIIYCPELIFSNLVPALDINFLNPDPSRYQSVEVGTEAPVSTGSALHEVVAAWYTAFRNIALVGLLSVLVYIGIRIVISSSAGEKAQYKERITDWLVALCLLFVIQYIMSLTINITQQITTIFSGSQTIDVIVKDTKVVSSADASSEESSSTDVTSKNVDFAFTTNLMGYMRFMVYLDDLLEKCAYLIIYLVLVIYTVMFTFIYLKRVLYMAFFTMIAPLVALTYPLDKLSDGKAQAFNLWLREYIFNALIQPMHLALYTMLMTSSMHLATTNPIYSLVAIGFLFPAEKFIKKMFGFDKAQTASGAGSFVGGALTMALLNRMRANGGRHGSSSSGQDYGGDYIEKGVKTASISSGALPNPVLNPSPTPQNPSGGSPSPSGGPQALSGGSQSPSGGPQVLNGGSQSSNGSTQNPSGVTNLGGSQNQNGNFGQPQNANISFQNNGTTTTTAPDGTTIFNNPGNQGTITSGGVILTGNAATQYNRQRAAQNNMAANAAQSSLRPAYTPPTPYKPTFKQRMGMRGRNLVQGTKRRLKKAPKSLGKFALNTGVSLAKGAVGVGLTAIPAAVTLLASGGDVGAASKILTAGGATMMTIGPTGDDISQGISNAVSSSNRAARTAEEQKEVDAKKQYTKTVNDTAQLEKLRKVMKKGDKEDFDKYQQSPEKWLSKNKDIVREYMKNDVKNLDTIYKAEKLRNAPGSNMDKNYAIELARQSDLIGKRVHNPGFMQDFRNELNQNMSQQDTDRFLNHLNTMDTF